MRKLFTNLTGAVLVFILFINAAFAQQNVKGKITDATTGETLIGVSVLVKGSTTGTQTDVNGTFSIIAPANSTLTFTYVGYTTQEVAVNNQTTINVKLASAATQLAQVVVVGYGTQRKIDVTGSVAQIKGEELSKQPDPNPVSALQGKVAGLQITNSGQPGASPQIIIRGTGTVYGSNTPLYVVDGVWYDDINFLNSNDIESMSILKDASSESIYGVRAANGVVLVTTRKGKGKPTVNYNAFVGFQTVTNKLKMANASQYATLVNELNGTTTFANPASLGVGTNWYDQILRNAFTTSHNLSVSGGTDKSSFNFSVGYFKQDGTVNKNTYDRITSHLQQDVNLSNSLKIGYSAVLQGSGSTDVPIDLVYHSFTASPVVPVYNPDGTYGDPAKYPIGNIPNNPKAQLDYFDQKNRNYNLSGNVYGDLTFAKYFKFHTSFGGQVAQNNTDNYIPVYKATTNQYSLRSLLTLKDLQTRNWIAENTLTFDKTFAEEHKLTVLLGQTAQHYKTYNSTASAYDVPNNTTGDRYLALGSATDRSVNDGGSLATYSSYFGRVNYSFRDKYLLNASLRADGSSKFLGSQRWGYFPSIGAGWVISNEEFMKNQHIFDNLKLRGSWGKVGNASVPSNLSILTVTRSPYYTSANGGVAGTGANITTLVNPVTYWERGVGTDIGLEAAFLNNRLTFEADYYEKRTEQAIFAIPVLASLGTTNGTIIGNQATFRNRGLEFTANWRQTVSDDFSYSIGGNFSFNNNKVLSVITGNNPIYAGTGATGGQLTTITQAGLPIGVFYGYKVQGVFQNAAQIASSAQKDASPGDFKYQDTNGDGVIDARDRIVLGNPNPKYLYGLNTNFKFKQFDLTVDVQGVGKVDLYNANKGLRYGAENFTQDFYNHRWHGDGTSNTYPSANVGGGANYYPNSWFVEDGSYIRLRNVQLGYNLPDNVVKKLRIQRFRIYASAQNAINLFGYKGFNPEIGGQGDQPVLSRGIDNGVYPLFATYNLGVNVTF
ncbi:MAG: SusC/RagA family TonB-linked outer membrane protein [Mucilaginibacter sp.]|uniref:SusC/RagA family TonB-linked outer membrane protein n=1 Tax=Mucilaginibacter sp. TaxID=1882438 RepID=UPI0034E4A360